MTAYKGLIPNPDVDSPLARPWKRYKNPKYPEAIYVMERQNYRAYAYLNYAGQQSVRKVVVLDTGA